MRFTSDSDLCGEYFIGPNVTGLKIRLVKYKMKKSVLVEVNLGVGEVVDQTQRDAKTTDVVFIDALWLKAPFFDKLNLKEPVVYTCSMTEGTFP